MRSRVCDAEGGEGISAWIEFFLCAGGFNGEERLGVVSRRLSVVSWAVGAVAGAFGFGNGFALHFFDVRTRFGVTV